MCKPFPCRPARVVFKFQIKTPSTFKKLWLRACPPIKSNRIKINEAKLYSWRTFLFFFYPPVKFGPIFGFEHGYRFTLDSKVAVNIPVLRTFLLDFYENYNGNENKKKTPKYCTLERRSEISGKKLKKKKKPKRNQYVLHYVRSLR